MENEIFVCSKNKFHVEFFDTGNKENKLVPH